MIISIHHPLFTLPLFCASDWIIYVTDAGQANHFYMCFDLARDAGWAKQQRLDHIGAFKL